MKRVRRLLEGHTPDVAAGSGSLAGLTLLLFVGAATCFAMPGDDKPDRPSKAAKQRDNSDEQHHARKRVRTDKKTNRTSEASAARIAKGLRKDLVVHYSFDDDDTIVYDESGNENHGVTVGDVKYEPSPQGRAARFTSNRTYVLSDAPGLNMHGWKQVSVSVWINTKRYTTYGRLISRGEVSGDGLSGIAMQAGSGSSKASFSIGRQFQNGPAIWEKLYSSSLEPRAMDRINQWVHVVGTFDGDSLRFFVNGKLDREVEASGHNLQLWDRPTHKLVIGNSSLKSRMAWADKYFDGLVDEVKIWRRNLSTAEIKHVYRQGRQSISSRRFGELSQHARRLLPESKIGAGQHMRPNNDRQEQGRANAPQHESALLAAAVANDDKAVKTLLEKGVNVNATATGEADEKNGYAEHNSPTLATALHWAAFHGNLRMARRLLEAGADIEAKDGRNWTPLYWSAGQDNRKVLQFLLERRACVNFDQWSPLHLAANSDDIENDADSIPKHLRHWPGLSDRVAGEIVNAPEADVRVAKGYAKFADKGKVHNGRRVTIMTAKRKYAIGEEVRVIHVLEAVKPGGEVYVMGPKAVYGEYVDGHCVTDDPPEAVRYDGRVLDSPAVDYNYVITKYNFKDLGEHTIQWKAAGPHDGKGLKSNVLRITVGADDTAGESEDETQNDELDSASRRLNRAERDILQNYHASSAMVEHAARICLRRQLTKAEVLKHVSDTMRSEAKDDSITFFFAPSQ